MNDDILKGKWKQIRGDVRTWWGKITDDEVDQIAGHREKLAGILQERYGYTKDESQEQINRFLEDVEMRLKPEPER